LKSSPYFTSFIPFGYQRDCLDLLYNHDYSKYTPEILLSGSVGSAKSILCAHAAISHCLRWPGARVAISRLSLPDLRKTIYQEIIEHLSEKFIENIHFKTKSNTCEVTFPNGSEIIAVSFGDKRWSKVRSLKLSGIVIEEATDFPDEFYEQGSGFTQFKARLRRIHNVPENFLLLATNPGEPESFLHNYFIDNEHKYESRYVFYSVTTDNKYLDPIYINQLRQDYSPIEAEKYLRGQWISIAGKGIYAAYDPKLNRINKDYKIDTSLPIRISFDFNISENKPMSCVLSQYRPRDDTFHFYDESVIDGSYTQDIMEDLWERGLLNHHHVIVHGDATGKARNPGSKLGNYDVIRQFLESKQINYEMKVPRANPPIRKRHSIVNAYCKNDLEQVRLYIYKKAKTAHQGMLSTRLKKGANYIEDDSTRSQHITTAIGYGMYSTLRNINRKSGVRQK
jgi:PBSX family phage terminase large subunit